MSFNRLRRLTNSEIQPLSRPFLRGFSTRSLFPQALDGRGSPRDSRCVHTQGASSRRALGRSQRQFDEQFTHDGISAFGRPGLASILAGDAGFDRGAGPRT
jgi:hypothetical protein